MRKTIFFFLTLLTFGCTLSASPATRLRQLSVNNGLSHYMVHDIVQDEYGFIWIGTDDGLDRYDGGNLVVYRNDPDLSGSIAGNRVKALNYDPVLQELWIGTDGGGINIFDYGTDLFQRFYLSSDPNSILAENDILDLASESSGRVWVATRHSLFLTARLDDGLKILQEIPYRNGPIFKKVFQSGTDLMFVAFNTELHRYRKTGGFYELDLILYPPDGGRINNVTVDQDGRLYVCTRRGLCYAESSVASSSLRPLMIRGKDFPQNHVFNFLEFADDDPILAVAETGLYRLIIREDTAVAEAITTTPESFWKENNVRHMAVDFDGLLWVGSSSQGVGIVDLSQFQFNQLHLDEDDTRPLVSTLYISPSGDLWTGTQNGGLFRTGPSGISERYPIPAGVVTGICEFEDKIYVCVAGNVLQFDRQTSPYSFSRYYSEGQHPGITYQGNAYNIIPDGDGKLWIACRKGLIGVNGGVMTAAFPYDLQSSVKLVSGSQKKQLWLVSARGGVLQIELDDSGNVSGFFHYRHVDGDAKTISSDVVWDLICTRDGHVYAGTDAGMCVIDPTSHTVSRMPDKSLLHNCKVLAINEDSSGVLWVNTTSGVVRVERESGIESRFDASDGLSSNSMTDAAVIGTGDVFYVGTNEGVNYFSVQDLISPNETPRVLISSLLVGSSPVHRMQKVDGNIVIRESILETGQISLKYDQNNISFGISVLDFRNPGKRAYYYRLVGYNDEWTLSDGSQRYVSYWKLKPGSYRFELAAMEGIVPSADVRSVRVIVRRPPWASIPAYIAYVLVAMAILAYMYLSYRRQKEARNERMLEQMRRSAAEEANENKLRFYANVTHELRTPLTLVTAPLKEIGDRKDIPEDVQSKLSVMKRNAQRLLELVNQFLDLRKIENQTLPLSVSQYDCATVVREVASRFETVAEINGIDYRIEVPDSEVKAWIDADKLSNILVNLLSNAFKYTPAKGVVKVTLLKRGDMLDIIVSDSGKGIDKQDLPHIFERFYQGRNAVSGSGIGLELVGRLVKMHGGSVEVDSQVGKGSVFSIHIPCDRASYDDSVISFPGNSDILKPDFSEQETASSKTKNLLIVEDDDDMRQYLKSILEKDYSVSVAADGENGFAKALQLLPDIIVSDMMMPGLDGAGFCRRLKEDIRTSHIPVVIVSAKNAETEGLSSGAVDYIMKPFDPTNLLLKIRNLLKYWESYDFTSKPQETIREKIERYESEREKDFLDKAYKAVEEHLSDGSFNVESLYKELAISKTLLHKKITTLTGSPASAFIRNIRLDKAMAMLRSGKYSITEVLYSVGFNSPSYFSKTFKERFGVSPSDFISC